MVTIKTLKMLATATVLATLVGCPYISAHTLEVQLCKVDEDGDGDPKNICNADGVISGISDCNDQEATIFRGAVEVPYDGIDQDCDVDHYDLVDVDYDGYPGISRYDFEKLPGDAVWPPDVVDVWDCDDNDNQVHVGASDLWYDGIDSDCTENDDYDADGDGFASLKLLKEYTGNLPATDCDDHDEAIFPNADGEQFYDGIDTNCDGANDFDEDNDTFIATLQEVVDAGIIPADVTQAEWDGLYAEFIARYGYDHLTGAGPDCDDQTATTNPSVTETWYDGIDADCAGDDDFDADADGFASDLYPAAYAAYGGLLPATDCDDFESSVNDAATEIFGDNVDQDCDSNNNTARFSTHDYEWVNPQNVVLGATDDRIVLVTGADKLTDTFTTSHNVGVALLFDPTTIPLTTPDERVVWYGSDVNYSPLTNTIDAAFFSDRFYVGGATTDGLLLHERTNVDGTYGTFQEVTFDNSANASSFSDIDIDMGNDGALWAFASGNSGVALLKSTPTGSGWSDTASGFSNSPSGYVGLIEATAGSNASVTNCADGGSCGTRSVTLSGSLSFGGSSTTSLPSSVSGLRHTDDLIIATSTGTGGQIISSSGTYSLPSIGLESADAVIHNGTLYAVGVKSNGDVICAFGSLGGSLNTTTYTATDTLGNQIDVYSVAITATDDNLVIAVSGTNEDNNDVVGWAFFNWL